jgi:spore germination cell wall hydrolase CwlJ-like protein
MTQGDVNYLAATLVGEARGEPIEGQVGVANVILNRARASNVSIKEICLAPEQFSCWNHQDSNFNLVRDIVSTLENGDEIQDPMIRQCIAIAREAENFLDNTKGARNYVTVQRLQLAKARNGDADRWILRMKSSIIIGRHCFLVETNRGRIKKA